MSFWSGETLRAKLPDLISPFSSSRIDCSSYTLAVGDEIYVSPSNAKERRKAKIEKLKPGEDRVIPPGQFAFLITAETIKVPRDAMALISIKAKIKWRGLVNVSGFHADPGYEGRLIFAVFNAGPSTIHLKCGDECFLVWFASLDRETSELRATPGYTSIPTELVSGISGDWKSLYNFEERMATIEQRQTTIYAVLGFLIALAISLGGIGIKAALDGAASRNSNATSTQATTTSPTASPSKVPLGSPTYGGNHSSKP